jgi:hypothetical protein
MKKLKFIALIGLVSLVISCGDDGPLKSCVACTDNSTNTAVADECGGKAAMELYKSGMESSGYTCHTK